MKHWFKDQHFRSLLKNTSYLAISRVVAAICGLATLAFAGRGLGVILFGTLILITSYAKAASGLSQFQSWQLIVRYGGHALANGETDQFKSSVGFAFALDLISGFGGMVLALLILPFLSGWFGIPDKYLWLALLYCTLLPAMTAATPVGVLRALDRFDLISWQQTVTPAVRALLAGAAFASHAPFAAYVAVWYVTDLTGDLYLWFLAWRELRRERLLAGIRPTVRPALLPGAWRFAIHVNLTSSLVAAWGPIARLIVGGLLGPAAAAIFRVASSLADSAQKPADLLGKAFYPEVVRMDLATKKPWKLMLRGAMLATAVAGLVILLLVIGGKELVGLLFGKDFLAAYPVMVALMAVPLLAVLSFPLPPMLYALDRPDAPLKARLGGTLIYFLSVAPFCWRWGVMGAAAAFVLAYAAMVAVQIVQLWDEYRRLQQSKRALNGA